MKIISSKPKGQRIKKSGFFKLENKYKTKRPFWIEPVIKSGEPFLCFNTKTGEWGKTGYTSVYYAMTYYGFNNVYSLKAVKRLINKWNVPKGTKFKASLPFVGYDFSITK
jgi:hypothetical protein